MHGIALRNFMDVVTRMSNPVSIETDGVRFELTRRFNPSTRFPGVRLKPLIHLSVGAF